jgi:ParB family chromosome partitioning protein
VALTVGKSRSHVANMLRLLNLPDGVRAHLAEGRISIGHARAIASAPDPAALAESIVKHGLSVRQAEQLARKAVDRPVRNTPRGSRTPTAGNADVAAIENDLADALGLSVQLIYTDGRGELRIRYETLDQLDDICQRLTSR